MGSKKKGGNGEVTFKIDAGVEIPPTTRERGSKYPFTDMKRGESFFAPTTKDNLYRVAWFFKKKHEDFNFKVRAEGDGARIWRVK